MCHPCTNEVGADWRTRHPERAAATQKGVNNKRFVLRRTDPSYRAVLMWRSARTRAERKGIPFDLTLERVERAVVKGVCEVTGLRFDLDLPNARAHALSPTIDRVDSALGYVMHNVQITCWLYNRAKADGTHEDVMMLVRALGVRPALTLVA